MRLGGDTFVGRTDQTHTLDSAWAQVRSGISRVVWIEGESGIGKTTLLRHFTGSLAADQVVWVSADPDEKRRDLGIVRRLLHLLDATDATTGGGDDDPGRILLDGLTRSDHPYAVVIDDLQWVDQPSLLALRFALRRLESDGVLVVLTGETDSLLSLGDPWRHYLSDPHQVTRIDLDGLTGDDLAALARELGLGDVDRATVERLRAHTGGHPLHAVALLHEVGPEGLAGSVGVLPSPRSFAEVTLARLMDLDEPARALVRAGSILGVTFALTDAAAIGGLSSPTAALDVAVEAGLLRAPTPETTAFTHPMVRSAIYNNLRPVERRAMHRSAAHRTGGIASLLHEAESTEHTDEELAGRIEAAAVAESVVPDPSRTADLLFVAARVAEATPTSERLTLQAIETLIAGSHLTRALALRPKAAACTPGAQRELVLALGDSRSGDFDAAMEGFRAAADLARQPVPSGPSGPGDVRSRALGGAAFVAWFQGDSETALDLATEALRGDIGWGASLICYARAMSLVHLGRFDDLATHPLPDPVPATLGEVDRLAITGIVWLYLDDLGAAAADLHAAVDLGRRAPSSQLFAMALSLLAEVELRRGRWDAAAIHADLAIAFATDVSGIHALVQAHTVAVELEAARGRPDEAERHLRQAADLATAAPAWGARTRVAMARAALALVRGDPRELIDAAASLTGGDLRRSLRRFPTWRWRATVAEARLAEGDLDGAETIVENLAAIVWADKPHVASLGAAATVTHLHARIAEGRGAHDEALDSYGRVPFEVTVPAPLPVARMLIDHADLLRRLGGADEAIPLLRQAQVILSALGATAFQPRCRAALAACGAAMGDGDRSPIADLTPRQEAVALLIAEGMTNKEIATELFIGAKTVEYHLSQIYTKLDLHSRRDVAGLIRRQRDGTV